MKQSSPKHTASKPPCVGGCEDGLNSAMIVLLVCKGLDRRIYEGEEGGEKNCFIPDFDISESDVAFRLSLSRASLGCYPASLLLSLAHLH